ncbi:2'-5' RNA ligase family protein [Kitasatospora cineracea]|uniref:2'-5' RNA ligase family protein n=1 Tax=Kitasatospora cineracea TaxID=88074 RepID=UPI0036DA4259
MDDFFTRVTTRRNPWPTGRRDLHWHVLPDPVTARALAGTWHAAAAHPGLNPVPEQWLHVTVLHAGPTSEASGEQIQAMADLVREQARHVAPFDLLLGRPQVGTVALECAGTPGAPARRLWELTAAATRAVFGNEPPLLPALYYPHCSIAYAGPDGHLADRTALKALLSDVPGGPVTIPVTRLALVSQWHDGRSLIQWEPLLEIPLGAP